MPATELAFRPDVNVSIATGNGRFSTVDQWPVLRVHRGPMFVVTAVKPDGRHVVYLTERSGTQSPWIAPNEIGTGRQIVNGFVASELSVGVSPHTRSVVLSTIDERGSPTRRMRDSLSPIADVR